MFVICELPSVDHFISNNFDCSQWIPNYQDRTWRLSGLCIDHDRAWNLGITSSCIFAILKYFMNRFDYITNKEWIFNLKQKMAWHSMRSFPHCTLFTFVSVQNSQFPDLSEFPWFFPILKWKCLLCDTYWKIWALTKVLWCILQLWTGRSNSGYNYVITYNKTITKHLKWD